MYMATVTLKYGERIFSFSQTECFWNFRDITEAWDRLGFMWTEHNYSCDCNRSRLIREHCDPEFSILGCGDRIELVELAVGEVGDE